MAFQVDGKLHKVFATEQKSEKFRARDFVIEISEGKFPQLVKFQLTQEKCEAVDDCREGDEVTVHFDLRGREWNGKYFTNLNAWRVDAKTPANQGAAPMPSASDYPELSAARDDFEDDVPF